MTNTPATSDWHEDFKDFSDRAEDAVGYDAAADIGFKVVEMADRVKVLHIVIPGARASWAFEMDDIRYRVVVTVETTPSDIAEAEHEK